jgi:hypothetical protein
METEIYIRRKLDPSQMEGPFSVEHFLQLIEAREVLFGDYAWKTGTDAWVLAGSLAVAFRPRREEKLAVQPPELTFERRVPSTEAAQRDLFLRMDRVRLCPHLPPECVEIALPLHIVLCSSAQQPGGKLLRRLATEFTHLFAARVRFEQAGLLNPHPMRALMGEKNLDNDLADDEIAMLACEELKRRTVLVGADLLVEFAVRFDFIAEGTPGSRMVPVVIASGLAGFTEETNAARRAKASAPAPAEVPAGEQLFSAPEAALLKAQQAELAERQRQLEEREAFLIDAEARIMEKIEEHQVREVELDHLEDMLRAREKQLAPEA